jgi:hypothetical protein
LHRRENPFSFPCDATWSIRPSAWSALYADGHLARESAVTDLRAFAGAREKAKTVERR